MACDGLGRAGCVEEFAQYHCRHPKGVARLLAASESRSQLALTVRVSFKHNDEILGARITYQSQAISDDDRVAYYGALLQTLKRCSPLPLSAGLGGAIAGRPLTFHIQDTRQQRKA